MSTSKMGRYELITPLGRGGMAEVWRARVRGAARFSREVALKIMLPEFALDPGFVTMFVDEACLSAKLKHPNIVGTLDFGLVSGRYFIALELIDGLPLRALQVRRKGEPLPLAQALYIVAELAAALDYAYGALGDDGQPLRLVHRDVNPSNVMITTHGLVKLNDFGIAKAVGTGSLTQAGQLKGKLSYMSPEQAWGRELDGRSDIYAMGLLLYELLVGTRAIRGDHEIAVLEAARAGVSPSFPAHVPEQVVAIARRALATSPADRYPTAGAMRVAILDALAGAVVPQLQEALGDAIRKAAQLEQADLPSPTAFRAVDPDTFASIADEMSTNGTEVSTHAGVVPRASLASVLPPRTAKPVAARGASRWWAATILPVAAAVGWLVRERATQSSRVEAPAPVVVAPKVMAAAPSPPVAIPVPTSPETPPVHAANAHHERGPATVRIAARPWAEVWVDGKDIGMTPLRPIELAPGRHEILGRNPTLGKRRVVVNLTGGERKHIDLEFDKGKP